MSSHETRLLRLPFGNRIIRSLHCINEVRLRNCIVTQNAKYSVCWDFFGFLAKVYCYSTTIFFLFTDQVEEKLDEIPTGRKSCSPAI